jgi:AcrR family transcriptional regulator
MKMQDEKELKDRILAKAEELFFQYGYSKITMEEVAAGLGMSKKTLYKFFPSKETLVKNIIENKHCEVEAYIDDLLSDSSLDFVTKLKQLLGFVGKQTSKYNGPLLHDLQMHIPQVWEEINEFKKKNSNKKVSTLIDEGVEKGIFRKEIDKELIILIYMNAIQGIINPVTLAQLPYTGNQVFETISKILFEGILTEEGRAKYLSSEEHNKN